MTPPELTTGRLRGQLLQLGERFIGFDKVVESETRRAKEVETERTNLFLSRVSELEKAVHGEVRARAESNRQFQSDIEQFSNTVFEKMQNRIAKKIERILAEIDMLETRCVTLERGQQQFRGDVPSKLQIDTAALVKEMQSLKTRLEADVQLWRAREEAVVRKMELTVKNVVVELDKFEVSESDILNRVRADLSKLATNNKTRNDSILGEISYIRQAVQLEEENRKFADSEILTAVNSYTGVLQKGLKDVIASR